MEMLLPVLTMVKRSDYGILTQVNALRRCRDMEVGYILWHIILVVMPWLVAVKTWLYVYGTPTQEDVLGNSRDRHIGFGLWPLVRMGKFSRVVAKIGLFSYGIATQVRNSRYFMAMLIEFSQSLLILRAVSLLVVAGTKQ